MPRKKVTPAAPAEAARPRPIITDSLFAGCGGMDLGFVGNFTYRDEHYEALPFEIIKAYDNNAHCVETYKQNIGPHVEIADLSNLPGANMPPAECLMGGFPCQDFSSCGPYRGLDSDRGQLYKAFVRHMDAHSPLVVVAENVLHLKHMQEGEVLAIIQKDLEAAGPGYRFEVWPLYAPDYGVPQTRSRLFFMGVRNDLEGFPQRPPDTHFMRYRSVDWAIDDLVNVTDESVPNQSQYFKANKAKNGRGQGDEVSRRGEPAYTVRSNTKSRIQFHYSLPRRLTIRECARIQTFPDTFVFPHLMTINMRQIGNAVPPILAHHLARSIAAYFETIPAEKRIDADAARAAAAPPPAPADDAQAA
ncbi:MAG: DNA (cytosine-5-)-methyltransferase [Acidobacteria bacterium]|nr:DNA (cytosine-5-)-methyltransferase [Acidobacteriota bacterium]